MADNSSNYIQKIKSAAMVVAKTTPFVIFGAVAFAALTSWKAKKKPIFKRSTSLALLHGGELALKRLVDYHEARADVNKLGLADCEFKLKISEERPNFRELAEAMSKLEMRGKEEYAIRTLKEELQKAQKNKRMHEAYEIEILLVEMLIYKAIIIMALEPAKKEEAEKYWKKFVDLRSEFSFQPMFRESMEETGIFKITTSFQEFQNVVKQLLYDINKALLRKTT
ncbi:uncharacterized protein LOC115697767 isoform X2 [Cannabis sativa]|uniref:uncharacterized protein LOC115697767 isoform X2 n=1 Tax=Cannabis sativa TaxID=3483 RepID=UPI0029CA4A59|nr:uncharacterized protein LOC115697767 isoform X2 [Cannabis sativa]